MSKIGLPDYTGPAAVYLWTLYALSLTHPLYAVLGKADSLPFFIAHQAHGIDVWIYVALLSFILPAVLCLAVWAIRLVSARLASVVYLLLMFLMFVLVWLPVPEKWFAASLNLTIGLSLFAAAACTALYVYTAWARTFLAIMSLAIIVSPLLFMTSGSIRAFNATPEARDLSLASRPANRPDIVMIVFDELPLFSLQDGSGGIDPVRYPGFHRLADTSNWYRNTITVHYTTSGALPSLLIGEEFAKYLSRARENAPMHSATPDRTSVPDNLFTLLEGPYQVAAIESTSKLAPESAQTSRFAPPLEQRLASLLLDSCVIYAHVVVPDPWRKALPVIEGQWSGYIALEDDQRETAFPGNARLVKQFLNTLQKTEKPTLFYLHVLLPHFPFIYSGQGIRSDNEFNFLSEQLRKATGKNQWPGETAADLAWQAHLLQAGYTDYLLGKVLDKMQELDMFDDSVIVVTADHGMSFYWDANEIGQDRLAQVQASEALLVPFFLKMPGQHSGLLSDAPIMTVDIVPTIADIAGLEIPWPVDGQSALSPIPEDRVRFARVPDKRTFGDDVDPGHLALKRKLQLFGSGDIGRLYRLGPYPEIVGSPVSSYPGRAGAGSVRIDRPERYADIDLESPQLPVYIKGEISGLNDRDAGHRINLAVAVNGIIQGTTVTTGFEISSLRKEDVAALTHDVQQPSSDLSPAPARLVHFLTRVPANSFKNGANEIGIFAIVEEASGGAPSLQQLRLDQPNAEPSGKP